VKVSPQNQTSQDLRDGPAGIVPARSEFSAVSQGHDFNQCIAMGVTYWTHSLARRTMADLPGLIGKRKVLSRLR
jgi:hypothetical protein